MKTTFFLKSILTYILFWFFYFLYIYLFKIRNQIEIIGKENLPKRANGILSLSNHQSFIDSLPIRAAMINFWDMFFHQSLITFDAPDSVNFYTNKIGAFFIRHLRNISVKRNTGDRKVKNEFVDQCCKTLEKNNLHLFFEGGRTIDEIRPCVSGVAEIILNLLEEKFNLIIIPIFINGMQNIMPREIGQKYFKISCGHKVKIIIGKPIDFSEIIEKDFSREKKINLIKKRVRGFVLALKHLS